MPRTMTRKRTANAPKANVIKQPRFLAQCTVAAIASSVLLSLSYFPVGIGTFAWVALVPWLMLVRANLHAFWRYPLSWLTGIAFFVQALSWMNNGQEPMYYLWLLLALYCSWQFPIALWFLRRLDKRWKLPLTITTPVVFTALEYFRSVFLGGFAWYLLGHSQQAFVPLIQIADLAGVGAVTFLVAAVNGWLAEWLSGAKAAIHWFGATGRTKRFSLRQQAWAVAALLLVTLGYGGWRLLQGDGAVGPRVALVQTYLYLGGRESAHQADWDSVARTSLQQQTAMLTKKALEQSPRPDLVVWPETSFPDDQKVVAEGAPASAELDAFRADLPQRVALARDVAVLAGTNMLLGLNTQVYGNDGKIRRFNSALLLTPSGDAVARYDKMHLVPFGEYLPLKDELAFVRKLSPYGDEDYMLTPGSIQTRLPLRIGEKTYHMGVLICYECSDARMTRRLVGPGPEPKADFIVNMSNDGWFMGTAEHAQHLAISRFRAIETRRSLIRSVNGGISAVIDGSGRIVAPSATSWTELQAVTAVVSANVPIDSRTSLYSILGDWLSWGCLAGMLIGAAWPKRRTKLY